VLNENVFAAPHDPPVSERRMHCRRNVSFSCAKFGEDNRGIILNISEDGLALQSVRELSEGVLLDMHFQLSQSPTFFVAKGRTVWRGSSKTMAGVEFVDLPDGVRKQIQAWITLTTDACGPGAQPIGANAFPNPGLANQSDQNLSPRAISRMPLSDVAANARGVRLIAVALAIVMLLSALFILGHRMRRIRLSTRGRDAPMHLW